MGAIPPTVTRFLAEQGATYEVVGHPHSATSLQTARHAHIDPAQLAKGVLLHDGEGYYLAVVPASRRLDVKVLAEEFGCRPQLVAEEDLGRVFDDCAPGAVPALGRAYGIDCVVDRALREEAAVFVEAGDHDDVIRLERETFIRLMGDAWYGALSKPADDV